MPKSKAVDLPHSYTGGVKPMNIEGRFGHERSRLSGEFTDVDRAWRNQWLKDQILAHDEPRRVPELEVAHRNVFRRVYRAPMDALFKALEPMLGQNNAIFGRWMVPKLAFIYLGFCAFHYMGKYNQNDWTRHSGLTILSSRPDILPCHENFPQLSEKSKPQDYADRGFNTRKVLRNI